MDAAQNELQTDEDVQEYLGQLLKGKINLGNELEQQALGSFKQISGRVDTLQANLQRSQTQTDNIKAQTNEANGEMKAYVNLLVGAERSRRKVANQAIADEMVATAAEEAAGDKGDKGGDGEPEPVEAGPEVAGTDDAEPTPPTPITAASKSNGKAKPGPKPKGKAKKPPTAEASPN